VVEFSNNTEAADEETKAILVAKIDKRVIPALDQIAKTNQVNTAQLMNQFFSDVADAMEFLSVAQGGSVDSIEDRLARLIVQRCQGTTPEALRTAGRIWDRAAELKSQEGGAKG
jgi:hypothetical protein